MSKIGLCKLGLLVLIIAGIFCCGCAKNETGAISKHTEIKNLIKTVQPLKVRRADTIEKITLGRAMVWHESRESGTDISKMPADYESNHLCTGVTIGFKAIGYAVEKLFGDEIVDSNDFEITVSGSPDGIWDVMSFYTGKDLQFTGKVKPMSLKTFIFTAKRLSIKQTIVFQPVENLIPQEFFDLKNDGATCSTAQLTKVKYTVFEKVLPLHCCDCFEIVP